MSKDVKETKKTQVEDVEKKDIKETTKKPKSKPEPKPAKKKREIKRTDLVEVKSNIRGTTGFRMANERPITFTRIGQTREVTVDDLEQLMATAPNMLEGGIFYIEDEEIRKFLYIDEFYKSGAVIDNSELEKVLELNGDKLDKALDNLSDALKDDLSRVAQENINSLTVTTIKALKDSGVAIGLD